MYIYYVVTEMLVNVLNLKGADDDDDMDLDDEDSVAGKICSIIIYA